MKARKAVLLWAHLTCDVCALPSCSLPLYRTVPQVPTDYFSLWGRRTHSYQYSVTEYYHQFRGGEDQPPAVYLL